MPYYPGKNNTRHMRNNVTSRCEWCGHDKPSGQVSTGAGGTAVCSECKKTVEYKEYSRAHIGGKGKKIREAKEAQEMQEGGQDKPIPDSGYDRVRKRALDR